MFCRLALQRATISACLTFGVPPDVAQEEFGGAGLVQVLLSHIQTPLTSNPSRIVERDWSRCFSPTFQPRTHPTHHALLSGTGP
eukprot:9471935-Pyramimonas_sp.AAC.3